MAAHAALRNDDLHGTYQTETGWGAGNPIVDKGSWSTYFDITLTCDGTKGGGGTETAFTFSSDYGTCFLDIDEDGDGTRDFSCWGWSNGVLSVGDYTFEIYAGAGQCDLSKGTDVGTLLVSYDGSTATVTYDITVSPYYLTETQLYVGSEILARNNGEFTVAPGQFPYKHAPVPDGSSDSYTIEGLSGGYISRSTRHGRGLPRGVERAAR